MTMTTQLPSIQDVQTKIYELPGREPFMLASALAEFYGAEPKRIGEAVRRNPERFPADFVFDLSPEEATHLRTQNATANASEELSPKARYAPLAFTESGALALSGVLKTQRAAQVSVRVHRGFVAMRRKQETQAVEQSAQLSVCHTHLLLTNPRWAKIRTAAVGGLPKRLAWQRSGLSWDIFQLECAEMERCGLLSEDDWFDGTPRTASEKIQNLETELWIKERHLNEVNRNMADLITAKKKETEH